MEPQFKNQKFNNQKDLDQWLKKHSYAAIYLQSKGQDMEKIQVHKTGEILDTDFHSKLYVGKFINIKDLRVDQPLQIWDDAAESWITYHNLIPEEVIY